MSSFEQKRNKQVFEIIVILKIIYIILSMIAISGFYNFNKESNNVILIPVMFSAVLITMLVYFSWTVVYIKDKIDKPPTGNDYIETTMMLGIFILVMMTTGLENSGDRKSVV